MFRDALKKKTFLPFPKSKIDNHFQRLNKKKSALLIQTFSAVTENFETMADDGKTVVLGDLLL